MSVFLFSLLSFTRFFTLLFSLGIYLGQIQLLVEVARVTIYPWPSKVLGTKVLGRQYLLCLFVFFLAAFLSKIISKMGFSDFFTC